MANRFAALVLVATLGFVTATPGAARSALSPEKCAVKKMKLGAKKASGLVNCQAKVVPGNPPDPTCVSLVESKYTRGFQVITTACGNSDQAALEASATACAANLACQLKTKCCDPAQFILTGTQPGTLTVGGIPFSFPTLATAQVYAYAAPDLSCKHDLVIPPNGFSAPTLCLALPGLSVSVGITPKGCTTGTALGMGTAWDGFACCPDANVSKSGDTSDGYCNPSGQRCDTYRGACTVTTSRGCNTDTGGAGSCDPRANEPCVGNVCSLSGGSCNSDGDCPLETCDASGPGAGAGANSNGRVDTTHGDGTCDTPLGVHASVDVPVTLAAWTSPNGCPDPDHAYTPGTDTLISQLDFLLTLTTDKATAQFADTPATGGDMCSFAGIGPAGPTSVSGSASAGPCYALGDELTLAAAAPLFTGSAPLNDVLFTLKLPMTVSAFTTGPPPTETCTIDTHSGCTAN